jgi:hypothetical protein
LLCPPGKTKPFTQVDGLLALQLEPSHQTF